MNVLPFIANGFYLLLLGLECTVSCTNTFGDHSLYDRLHHFEMLHKSHLQHNVRKGQQTLTFSTLNKTFHLELLPRQGLFSSTLEVTVVKGDGRKVRHAVDPTQFFAGTVRGEAGSVVSAHLDPQHGILTASILTLTEHFFVEPSHLHFHQSHDFHMISYRKSDIKTNQSALHCSTNSFPSTFPPPISPNSAYFQYPRQRRLVRTFEKNSCPLLLVATSSFYRAYSRGQSADNTILFMVQVIDDIDQKIFRSVEWDKDIKDFGLSIKNITVFEEEAGSPDYNQDVPKGILSSQLLQMFSHQDLSQFCLAHLFTFQTLNDSRAGVAYPASPLNEPGGICSTVRTNFNGGAISTPNVGLSSYRASNGNKLLLGEARLITAHELGHNWGSGHDPTIRRGPCNPPLSREEGKFLMFPSLNDGNLPNNDIFSPCSTNMISQVLQAKSQSCFEKRSTTFCGNYEVEDDEECDGGFQGMLNLDLCCTDNCKFRHESNCSDSNHECCSNCTVASHTKICRFFRAGNVRCLGNVTCDGVSEICPTTTFVERNTTCRDIGKCMPSGTVCNSSGDCLAADSETLECYDPCQLHNRKPCFCSGTYECHVCCQQDLLQGSNSTPPRCNPFSPMTELPAGTSCVGGLCDGSGECKLLSHDLISRLYTLFNDISINTILEFLAENVVGTVMFLTIVLWIIFGSMIHLYDSQYLKKVRKEADISLQDNKKVKGQTSSPHDTPTFQQQPSIERGYVPPESFPPPNNIFGPQSSVDGGYMLLIPPPPGRARHSTSHDHQPTHKQDEIPHPHNTMGSTPV